jgi:poly(A) polymerase
MMRAADEALAIQVRRTAVPRRFSAVTRQIWVMQARLDQDPRQALEAAAVRGALPGRLRLPAAAIPGRRLAAALCEFWTKAQEGVEIPPAAKPMEARRTRPRRRYRRRAPTTG